MIVVLGTLQISEVFVISLPPPLFMPPFSLSILIGKEFTLNLTS